jgi:hypothetical protein
MNQIKMKKFLFFNYWAYEYIDGFKREIFKPEKSTNNPVFISGERDYEYNSCGYATVIYDGKDKIFKMWYETSNMYDANTRAIKYLCYAVSKDGVNWERPELDIVAGTNIVMTPKDNPMGSSIIVDKFDEKYPYKLLMRPKYTPAVVGYRSEDGINWEKVSKEPLIDANSDCKVNLYQSPDTGTYFSYFRLKKGQRVTYTSTSNDFVNWSTPVLALTPHIGDGTQVQLYGLQAAPYGNYVLGLSPMYNTERDDLFWAKMNGTMDISLAVGESSCSWQWMEPGERFIESGEKGSWDGGMIHPTTSPVYLDNEIRFYYAGSSFEHGDTLARNENPQGIGYASLRPDGFVGLTAGKDKAALLTRPFAVSASEIYINADCTEGVIRVEVQDGATGKALKGYELANCIPIEGDDTAHLVEWKNVGGKEPIVSRSIRLFLEAQDSTLFSISLPNGNDIAAYYDFDQINGVAPKMDLNNDDYYMQA